MKKRVSACLIALSAMALTFAVPHHGKASATESSHTIRMAGLPGCC